MKIVLIGAGNLASNIGVALFNAGHNILQVYSRTKNSADNLADIIGCSSVTTIEEVCRDADVYIIAVKDSIISNIIPKLCTDDRKDKVFLHTAGSVHINVFECHALHYGVLYPMQTFSMARILDFNLIPCFIEGNDDFALTTVSALANSISEKIYTLSSDDRKYLHLSAVFACNFVNHCYDIASEILARHNIPFDVMLPLIDETAKKVHVLSPRVAQTGPAVRYDENVLNSQKILLENFADFQKIYSLMSKNIHQMAENKNSHD